MRSHLTYANVMATIAVFIALGGSSYAAVRLSKDSVRSAHIKNGEVRRGDLGRSAVDSAKVKDGALLAKDFKAGQLPAGAPGPRGAQGATGAVGATGATGPRGPSAVFEDQVRNMSFPAESADVVIASLTLPPGKYAFSLSAQFDTSATTAKFGYCAVKTPAGAFFSPDFVGVSVPASGERPFHWQFARTITETTTARFVCQQFGTTVDVWQGSIMAIAVDSETHAYR